MNESSSEAITSGLRVAVVGAGISGLSAAYLLSRRHQVELFEKDARLGGHAHTHAVEHEGHEWDLDSGFLVYNHRTYPRFVRLLARAGGRAGTPRTCPSPSLPALRASSTRPAA